MDLFKVQKLAVEYCYQYLMEPNTDKWDTAVSAFGVGYSIASDSGLTEIDRLRAESERLGTAHELFEAACEDIALLQAENKRLRSQWKPPETAPMDGTEILLKTNQGIVSAWFADEPPTNDALDNGVYDWVCFDDEFVLDGHGDHVLGWMPLPTD